MLSWWFWIYNWWLSPNEFGDAINPILWGITFFLVYKTFWLQKEMLQNQKDELQWQKEIILEQLQWEKNRSFRDFIEFLLEWVSLSISYLQVQGNNGNYKWVIKWESAVIWLKNSGVFYEWTGFFDIDRNTWLTNWWLVKLQEIVKSIKYIEEYIDENYKWTNNDRKNFYYRLIKDRISYNLYEMIMGIDATKSEAIKLLTFKAYILDTH